MSNESVSTDDCLRKRELREGGLLTRIETCQIIYVRTQCQRNFRYIDDHQPNQPRGLGAALSSRSIISHPLLSP